MIPKDWKLTTLGDICGHQLQTGPFGSQLHADEYQDEGVPVIMPKDLSDGRINYSGASKISQQKAATLKKHFLKPGDILFSRRGDVGRSAHVFAKEPPAICGTGCLRVRPTDNHLSHFVSHCVQRDQIKTWLEQNAVGQTMLNMNTTILGEMPLIIATSTKEQKGIIDVLTTWDRAIETTEQLIAAKEKRKQALMQRLLTGKVRFGEFVGEEWKTVRIGKLLKQVKRPVTWDDNETYRLLSLRRASGGLFHRESLPGRKILTKKMNTAMEGDFLISKMQIVHGASGLTTKEFDEFHISDSYLAFVPKNLDELDIRFFNWLSKTKAMYHKAYRSSYGVHIEKMTFNLKLWLKEFVKIPQSIREQQQIVETLEIADNEIQVHRDELEALKEQKKGLMQQLLTGKVRVKVNIVD